MSRSPWNFWGSLLVNYLKRGKAATWRAGVSVIV
jgi:hypothetical protein